MFGIFKRLRALEAENKSLNGMHHAVIDILTKIYVGKYAVQKTDPIFSFKIVEVSFSGKNIMIRGNNDLFFSWYNLNEYKIQDENPKAIKKSDVFHESLSKQIEEILFASKVADTIPVKQLHEKLNELKADFAKLKNEFRMTGTPRVKSKPKAKKK